MHDLATESAGVEDPEFPANQRLKELRSSVQVFPVIKRHDEAGDVRFSRNDYGHSGVVTQG